MADSSLEERVISIPSGMPISSAMITDITTSTKLLKSVATADVPYQGQSNQTEQEGHLAGNKPY
jgi:hypothetical protein